jgi:hypothetical protein
MNKSGTVTNVSLKPPFSSLLFSSLLSPSFPFHPASPTSRFPHSSLPLGPPSHGVGPSISSQASPRAYPSDQLYRHGAARPARGRCWRVRGRRGASSSWWCWWSGQRRPQGARGGGADAAAARKGQEAGGARHAGAVVEDGGRGGGGVVGRRREAELGVRFGAAAGRQPVGDPRCGAGGAAEAAGREGARLRWSGGRRPRRRVGSGEGHTSSVFLLTRGVESYSTWIRAGSVSSPVLSLTLTPCRAEQSRWIKFISSVIDEQQF